jgi:large subunit ribosomal protein L22
MKALLTNYHQSPQKVRLVANLIRGKSVADAEAALAFLPKKSAPAMAKLLASAVANAKHAGVSANDLVVKTISVDKGSVMRRFKPMARGRAAGIRKTMSIVVLELGTKSSSTGKPKSKKNLSSKQQPLATSH